MTQAKHTPVPWKAVINVAMAITPGHIIKADNLAETPIALVPKGGGTHGEKIQLATARFIVTACNSHYELLESLEDVVALAGSESPFWDKARAAIAKARGQA